MNGKQARALRKVLGIKKPMPAMGGYAYFDVGHWHWRYVNRSVPAMRLYRMMKRKFERENKG